MLQLKNIRKSYDSKVILDSISLDINDGEIVSILGPSGSGKTTLLNAILGLTEIDGGQIIFDGKDLTNVQMKDRGFNIVFQDYALFPNLNAYENIVYGLRNKPGISSAEEVQELISLLGLKEHLNKRIDQLSGGQKQRVALARTLVMKPKILLLDEPLSALDGVIKESIKERIQLIAKQYHLTTIIVTHDPEEALTLSDRIAVFNNGYVEQVGTPYEIYNESKSEFVCDFIGDINRLKGELLSEVNTQSGANLDTNKTGFVRIERCIIEEKAGYVKLTGKVEEAEFSGVLTKYVLECHGQELKYLEKNDGRRLYQENEQIDLYINPQDIMQF